MVNEELNQPITKQYLGEFTEKVLLPAVSSLIDDKFVVFEEKVDKKFLNFEEKVDKKFLNFEEKLDDKFADLKGDLVVLMRKEDRKLLALVEILQNRKVITQEDAKAILALAPFPKS